MGTVPAGVWRQVCVCDRGVTAPPGVTPLRP